ncbi:hypothetical protein QJS66_21400 [Kocuria rhizophila]|nr:hypothetical protein QJS66_21400 [Kocuria rhizophila]
MFLPADTCRLPTCGQHESPTNESGDGHRGFPPRSSTPEASARWKMSGGLGAQLPS